MLTEWLITWQERRSNSGLGTQVLVSTSWDGEREEYHMVPLYVLWNAPGEWKYFSADCQTFIRTFSSSENLVSSIFPWAWQFTTPLYWLKKPRATYSSYHPIISKTAPFISCMHFVRVLIGSLDCVCPLWLARVKPFHTKTISPNWRFLTFSSCVYLSMYWNITEYLDVGHVM